MYPQQPQTPAPGNNYDFILSPEQKKPPLLGGKLGNNPFLAKIIFIVAGAVVLMIVLAVVVNLAFGNRANIESMVLITQTEQEITRLSNEGSNASSLAVKNAASNTSVTIETHKQEWLAYLSSRDKTVSEEELALKRDAAIDSRLKNATKTSTFDTTYTTVMLSQLSDYADLIRDTYDKSASSEQRQILSKHYSDVQLLLKQWP
jgi:hypothetical protein